MPQQYTSHYLSNQVKQKVFTILIGKNGNNNLNEKLLELNSSISLIDGVGAVRQKILNEHGIFTLNDLLYNFPRRHLDRTTITPIRKIQKGDNATLIATVETCGQKPIRRGKIFQVIVSDGTGLLTLSWFNGIRYIKNNFKIGSKLAIHGKVDWYNGYTISHPEFEILEAPENGIQLHLGPFDVPPGGDMELLSYENLNFTEDVFIKRVKVSMRPGSHHFILYTFTDDIPSQFIPQEGEIRPFYDEDGNVIYANQIAMQYHKFVTGTQWPSMDFHFPEGVALRFPHEYGFDMNTHYLNYTSDIITGEIYTNLYFAESNEIEHVAEILMLSNTNINLPPNEVTTIERTYNFNQILNEHDLNNNTERINIFQLFTHAHQHMTRFDIELNYPNNTSELVYTALDWEHPPILQLNDPIILTQGMSLTLKCTYDNWTNDYLEFGLLSTDEMMILFGYFYTE